MSNIKVVIFDFDDTLYSGVNWAPWEEFCRKGLRAMFDDLDNESYNQKFGAYVDAVDFSDETIVLPAIELGGSGKKIDNCLFKLSDFEELV